MRDLDTQEKPRLLLLEPAAAYDRIAPEFARISERRKAYIDSIDELIVSSMPEPADSLLDVGAGLGTRAWHISKQLQVHEIVLLDPSERMRSRWPADVQPWAMRAEDLHRQHGQFDIILCLWNVLGHIFPCSSRKELFRQFARLLAPSGRLFLDINHRYNARHYGVLPTVFRFIRDHVRRNEGNGDVVISWDLGDIRCSTKGHVFTHAEICQLIGTSDLAIERRFVVDYTTGKPCKSLFMGNLFYVLKHRSSS